MVEATACIPGPVQRDGNDEQLGGSLWSKLSNGCCKPATERARGGPQAVVLEGVNGVAHPAVKDRRSDSPLEGRRAEAARAAKRSGKIGCWGVEAISASVADGTSADGNLRPADITNWNRKEARQEVAAEGAASGVNDATQEIHWTSEDTHHRAPAGGSRSG